MSDPSVPSVKTHGESLAHDVDAIEKLHPFGHRSASDGRFDFDGL